MTRLHCLGKGGWERGIETFSVEGNPSEGAGCSFFGRQYGEVLTTWAQASHLGVLELLGLSASELQALVCPCQFRRAGGEFAKVNSLFRHKILDPE